jgi:protein-S-isoprenylcysteine O-methyltransferase Ste14
LREKEARQRRILSASAIPFLLAFLLPGFDHRFGWSDVPVPVILAADALVLVGYVFVILVFRENRYASRVVEVETGQQVISTGPYSVVRHPMYLGTLLMYLLSPIALGSYWAALFALPLIWVLVARMRNEEEVLLRDLPGYADYLQRVRYRLIPGVW